MHKILFSIGNIDIPGYGFMIGIGFIAAILIGEWRAQRKGLDKECVLDMAIIAILCGFLGAKLLYVIVNFPAFIEDPISVLGREGFVVYGGIIAGVLACLLYCHIKKISFLQYFDLIMPEVAVAQGFGRIGCFMAGCCYGKQTDSAFGVIFPADSLAPAGVKLIPTQLISSVGDFLFAAILIITADVLLKNAASDNLTSGNLEAYNATGDAAVTNNAKKRFVKFGHIPGDIGCLYLWLYGTGRFAIEFLRDDSRGTVGVLSTSQFISLFIVLGGIVLFVVNRLRSGNEYYFKTYEKLNDDSVLIRKAVFVEEQGFKEEFDDKDDAAKHIVMYRHEQPIATCRMYWSEHDGAYFIGRIAVMKEFRGKDLGSTLLKEVERQVRTAKGDKICLSAQERARGFYEKKRIYGRRRAVHG